MPSVISFLLPVIFIFLGALLILFSRNTPAEDKKFFESRNMPFYEDDIEKWEYLDEEYN